jgi:hypothetical protein
MEVGRTLTLSQTTNKYIAPHLYRHLIKIVINRTTKFSNGNTIVPVATSSPSTVVFTLTSASVRCSTVVSLHRPTAVDQFSRRGMPCFTHWHVWLCHVHGGRQDARLEPKYMQISSGRAWRHASASGFRVDQASGFRVGQKTSQQLNCWQIPYIHA